jgi:hypothetical protein
LRHQVLSILAKLVIGFLLLGVLGVWFFLGFSYYIVFMLSPFLAPFVAPWAARTQEKLADRSSWISGTACYWRRSSPAESLNGRRHGRTRLARV